MSHSPDWIEHLPAAVTVTDEHGTILELNEASRVVFAADGGAALAGRSVFDCHPEPARTKTFELYAGRQPNHYTIRKNGRRKIVHQLPYFVDGVFRGFVEVSIPIPDELPEFDRDVPGPTPGT
jgi:hypothetical protein